MRYYANGLPKSRIIPRTIYLYPSLKANDRNLLLARALRDEAYLERQVDLIHFFSIRAKTLGLRPGVVVLPLYARWTPKAAKKSRSIYFGFFRRRLTDIKIPHLLLNWDDETIEDMVFPYDQHFNGLVSKICG